MAPPPYAQALAPAPELPRAAPGRKKALLIGCCYPGTSAALNGCINDVQCIEYCLKKRFGFQDSQITVLRDDRRDSQPTRDNIFRGIAWLLSDQRPGDSLFFHFSGHGSQQRDYSGDESDGMDETILPTDYKRTGMIIDDELNAALVRPLRPGVTLHAVIDACHSGTALDLAYQTKVDGAGHFLWKGKRRQKGTAGGTVFQLGACLDEQVAQDTSKLSGGSAYTGAATYSFIEAIERYGTNQTYAVLLQHMMETLRKHSAGSGGAGGGLGSMLPAVVAGGLSGGVSGLVGGLMMSFLTGSAVAGGRQQTPVMCCNAPMDLNNTRLLI